jgi:hypothetical protein
MNNLLKIIFVGVLGLGTLNAQTAKVIALSPEDAELAKSLYNQKTALEKKIADFQDGIKKHYLVEVDKTSSGYCWLGKPCPSYRDGWGFGEFEFSEDFKFIVPKSVPPAPILYNYNGTTFTSDVRVNRVVANQN